MTKQIDFRDNLYLRGDHVIHRGHGYIQLPIGGTLVDLVDTTAKIRYNNFIDAIEMGVSDGFLILSNKPHTGTWVLRSGDSMFGDLSMTNDSIIMNTVGNKNKPAYTFVTDTDTGIYSNGSDSLSIVLGSDYNDIDVIKLERFDNTDTGTNIFFEGNVWIDEITFTRRDGLKLSGDYAYFEGNIGLRLPIGDITTRHSNATALVRFNNTVNQYELGFADSNWGLLSLEKDQSSWFVRTGDSVTGDIQLTNNARVLLTNGSAVQPSITFDEDQYTGIFKDTQFNIVVESNRNNTPVLSIKRIGDGDTDNEIVLSGNVITNKITFNDELLLVGNLINVAGNTGIILPKGTTAQRSNTTGLIRYNSELDLLESMLDSYWLSMSGRQDTDTWVNRKGDSMYGNLRMTLNSKIINSYGTISDPSYTFINDLDTGVTRTADNEISIVVGSSNNPLPAIIITQTGNNDYDKDVVINGSLYVRGEHTSIKTTDLYVTDNTITLNKNGSNVVGYSGFEIEANNSIAASILYNFSNNSWNFGNTVLSGILTPINDLDAANMQFVNQQVLAEENRAIQEETRIENKFDSITNSLDVKITTEENRAIQEETRIENKFDSITNSLDVKITTEENRAIQEETRIENKFDSITNNITSQMITHTERDKLELIQDEATKNDTDENLRNRNTHTGEQPISSITGLELELNNRVQVEFGKGLSSNDFTDAYKTKLDSAIQEAPIDGMIYGRKDGDWVKVNTSSILEPVVDTVEATNLLGNGFTTGVHVRTFGVVHPSELEVLIQYRVQGTEIWSETTSTNTISIGIIEYDITNLQPATNYEYRAVIQYTLNPSVVVYGEALTVTTINTYIDTPTTINVEGSPIDVGETPTITVSPFTVVNGSDTYLRSEIKVYQNNVEIWSNLNANMLSVGWDWILPADILLENNSDYRIEVRHVGTIYGASEWGQSSVFSTKEEFFQFTPASAGFPYGGGFYSGANIVVDGIEYALIVAPKSQGGVSASVLQWKIANTATSGTDSINDGWSNSNAMNNADHPAAHFCRGLNINGYNDWYLPSKDELEICYRYLKPTLNANQTYIGANSSSNPPGANYTSSSPTQTSISIFQSGGTEAFDTTDYWTSTQYSDSNAMFQRFSNGIQGNNGKLSAPILVRAVRRVQI